MIRLRRGKWRAWGVVPMRRLGHHGALLGDAALQVRMLGRIRHVEPAGDDRDCPAGLQRAGVGGCIDASGHPRQDNDGCAQVRHPDSPPCADHWRRHSGRQPAPPRGRLAGRHLPAPQRPAGHRPAWQAAGDNPARQNRSCVRPAGRARATHVSPRPATGSLAAPCGLQRTPGQGGRPMPPRWSRSGPVIAGRRPGQRPRRG